MLRLCMYRWRREAGRVTFKARETWELYCRPYDRGVASPAPSYEVYISRTASPVARATEWKQARGLRSAHWRVLRRWLTGSVAWVALHCSTDQAAVDGVAIARQGCLLGTRILVLVWGYADDVGAAVLHALPARPILPGRQCMQIVICMHVP
jgi:hypothetical protein